MNTRIEKLKITDIQNGDRLTHGSGLEVYANYFRQNDEETKELQHRAAVKAVAARA